MATERSNWKFEIGLALISALFIGGSALFLRSEIPYIELPYNLRQFQYTLGFLMLALLVIVSKHSMAGSTLRKMSIVLALTSLVVLAIPVRGMERVTMIMSVMFGVSVVLFGEIYFTFPRGRPSVRPWLAALFLVLLVQVLYAEVYLLLSIQRSQNAFFLFGMLGLFGFFFIYSRYLYQEWKRTK